MPIINDKIMIIISNVIHKIYGLTQISLFFTNSLKIYSLQGQQFVF
jgi:hypothetical protein